MACCLISFVVMKPRILVFSFTVFNVLAFASLNTHFSVWSCSLLMIACFDHIARCDFSNFIVWSLWNLNEYFVTLKLNRSMVCLLKEIFFRRNVFVYISRIYWLAVKFYYVNDKLYLRTKDKKKYGWLTDHVPFIDSIHIPLVFEKHIHSLSLNQ